MNAIERMNEEHDFGRLYVRELGEAIIKLKDGDEEAKLDIIANAISYTHLLERHIDKEDRNISILENLEKNYL